jgi:uncharacterized membrane protein YozB (DUF420 family)
MNFFDNLMSPLGNQHCAILYYLGIIEFVLASILLVSGVFNLFDKKTRKQGAVLLMNSFVMFFVYYIYRIIYSMCVKSL